MDTATHISIWAFLKNSGYVAAFMVGSKYVGVSPESAAILVALISADFVTGVLKAGTINGWRTVKSSEFERGLVAKALIVLAPATVGLVGRGAGLPLEGVAQGFIAALIVSEGYSIIRNIYAVRTGRITEEFDAVAYTVGGVKNMLKRIITDDPPVDKRP